MEKEKVISLINDYFKAWVKKDKKLFLSTLHNEAIVRECTGAVCQGKTALEAWFTDWNKGTNRVDYWKIKSFGYDKENSTAYVEWIFKCLYENEEYEWEGASIIYFKDDLIIGINEYEMKTDKFYPYN